jgi:hypothetical protein
VDEPAADAQASERTTFDNFFTKVLIPGQAAA